MTRSGEFSLGNSPLIQHLRQGIMNYSRQQGHYKAPAAYARAGSIASSPSRLLQVAEAHEQMPEWDDKALPAYRAMREETGRQYDHLTKPVSKGGMGINIEMSKEDPYGRDPGEPYANRPHDIYREMHEDVSRTGRLKVLSTNSTGGHPFFSDEENDRFRAVHDVWGHLASARGVDRHGEEGAFQAHLSTFSPKAKPALGTELRGQVAYLIKNQDFPKQRVATLPEHMQGAQFLQHGITPEALDQARDFTEKQRLG